MLILALFLVAQSQIALPAPIRSALDQMCAGWQLASVTPEIEAEIHTRTPSWPVNLIPGDFNGDRQTDAAVLVECKGMVRLVVFLATPSGFSREELEVPQPIDQRQFLHLIRQEYEHDAIGVEYEAIGGHAWIYHDGKWEKVAR